MIDENFEMIKDIYLTPNPLTEHVPFKDLREINDKLMRERAYHSQIVMEFYLLVDAAQLMKEKWMSVPLLQDFLYCALINQRVTEYAIVCHHFDVGLAGIKMDSKENLFMLGLCLYALWKYLGDILDLSEGIGLLVARTDSKVAIAEICQKNIERIFKLLQNEKVKMWQDKKNLCKRLALCNDNLNAMIVVMHPVSQ